MSTVLFIGPVTNVYGGFNKGGVAQCVSNTVGLARNVDVLPTGRFLRGKRDEPRIIGYHLTLHRCLLFIKNLFLCVPFLKEISKPRLIFKNVFLLFRYCFSKVSLKGYATIHIHGLDNFPYALIRHLQSKNDEGFNVKIVLTVHSYHMMESDDSYFSAFNKYFLLCDHVIHVSHADYERSCGLGFRLPRKVVHNFTSFSPQLSRNEFFSKAIDFIFVGSDIPRKRFELFFELAGHFPSRRSVALGFSRHIQGVEVLGYKENSIALKYMADSKTLVVPSLRESFGLVYVEALCNGCRVIGYEDVIEEFLGLCPSISGLVAFIGPADGKDELVTVVNNLEMQQYPYEKYREVYADLKSRFGARKHFSMLNLFYNIELD